MPTEFWCYVHSVMRVTFQTKHMLLWNVFAGIVNEDQKLVDTPSVRKKFYCQGIVVCADVV